MVLTSQDKRETARIIKPLRNYLVPRFTSGDLTMVRIDLDTWRIKADTHFECRRGVTLGYYSLTFEISMDKI